MNVRHIASLLVAVSAVLATPAFASGYGPAPFQNPLVGAPASQRGQSVQTIAAERGDAATAQHAYGGVSFGHGESGSRIVVTPARDGLYGHH
jgi:hypothetical protein